ncbi:MAG: exopolysaccharide biosynthesis polyprenyl glycosylphosphotransferase [Oscillospiraceae bacterium]
MNSRPKRLFVLFMRLFAWALSLAVFFRIMSLGNPLLLVPGRTSVIVALAYTILYLLMLNVYGGFDIGTRKSSPIAFSMALVMLFSDLTAHLFLCIMDYTLTNDGHFVYEHPQLLLLTFVVQVALTTGLVYLGNALCFSLQKPQSCVLIVREGDDYAGWVRKIAKDRRQYAIKRIVYTTDADIYAWIDAVEAVFLYDMGEAERAPYVEYCYRNHKDLYFSLEMADVILYGGKRVYFDDSTMIFAAADKMSVGQEILKRIMDIVISTAALILCSPLILITAIAIKLEDGGDIFYQQKRATYAGQEFNIIKFRSMRPEVGDIHRSVTDGDDRITKVGRVIRKFRIDEIPQLWNVLRGEMSIVGPRPEMLENIDKYTEELPRFAYRLRVRAGLTGLAQVYGSYNSSPRDKLIMDLLYIENYSIWLDIKLILRTFLVFLMPERSTAAFEEEPDEENLDPELRKLLNRE